MMDNRSQSYSKCLYMIVTYAHWHNCIGCIYGRWNFPSFFYGLFIHSFNLVYISVSDYEISPYLFAPDHRSALRSCRSRYVWKCIISKSTSAANQVWTSYLRYIVVALYSACSDKRIRSCTVSFSTIHVLVQLRRVDFILSQSIPSNAHTYGLYVRHKVNVFSWTWG